MPVATNKVQNRRTLRFTSFDDIVAEAEKLAAAPHVTMLGNWPLSQLFTHIAGAIDHSIDGIHVKAPWYFRVFGFFVKGRMLKNGMPAGFKLPREVEAGAFPLASSPQEALEKLRRSAGRVKTEKMTSRHPVLGKMTHEQWTQLHLRHAELHLSFALPQ